MCLSPRCQALGKFKPLGSGIGRGHGGSAGSDRFGTDPNARRSDGYAAIHLAAKQGQLASVKVLLANGASIEERDHKHAHTAVHKAAWASRPEVLAFYSQPGRSNPRDTDGDMVPLHWATNRRILKLLLTAGPIPMPPTLRRNAAAYGRLANMPGWWRPCWPVEPIPIKKRRRPDAATYCGGMVRSSDCKPV